MSFSYICMSQPPHPLPSHMPQPSQLQGDQFDIAEMSLECSFEDERSDPGREVLVMTVDLGKGKKDRLVVRDRDSPRRLARSFCVKHGLSEKLAEALTTSIRANLAQLGDGEVDSSLGPSYQATEEDAQAGTTTIQSPKPFVHTHYHSNPRNIGDRLYSQAISSKGSRALQTLKSRQESQLEADRELTFVPQIRQSVPLRSEESTWQQQLTTKREIDVKRREKTREETEQCTFTPVLCQR